MHRFEGLCKNPQLHALIPPLSPEELTQLEQNVIADGCRDALIVWQETSTILDGHHRYTLCTQHGILFTTTLLSLPNLDAAKAWMLKHQLGRRNLTPEQISYLRGEEYGLQKQQHGGDRKSASFIL